MRLFLFTAVCTCFSGTASVVSAQVSAGYYNLDDITVINAMIENNGLKWTKADPADGSYIPDDWYFIGWTKGETDLRINNLDMPGPLPTNTDVEREGALNGDLDLSKLTCLERLDCTTNRLTSLNVSGLTALKTLKCYANRLTSMEVSGLVNLRELDCSSNELTTLEVSELTELKTLNCSNNNLVSLDASELVNLNTLDCHSNKLTSLPLTTTHSQPP